MLQHFPVSCFPRRGFRDLLNPIAAFIDIQLGIFPPVASQRQLLISYFSDELKKKNISHSKVHSLSPRFCAKLLRECFFSFYFSIPFRLFTFNVVFSNPSSLSSSSAEIGGISIYNPARNEQYSSLVSNSDDNENRDNSIKLTDKPTQSSPSGRKSFLKVWDEVLEFLNRPEPQGLPGAGERLMLLSYGAKLADVSIIKSTLESHQLTLPDSIVFGDAMHIIRDAHRRRPVTADKQPSLWSLKEILTWLKLSSDSIDFKTSSDAQLTWIALSETLERYGDHTISPRAQLVSRFFNNEALKYLCSSLKIPSASILDANSILSDSDITEKSPSAAKKKGIFISNKPNKRNKQSEAISPLLSEFKYISVPSDELEMKKQSKIIPIPDDELLLDINDVFDTVNKGNLSSNHSKRKDSATLVSEKFAKQLDDDSDDVCI